MYFSKFFDKDIFEVIAQQTNLYSCQLTGCSINTNVSEIKAFIGMKLIMGIVKCLQWKTTGQQIQDMTK